MEIDYQNRIYFIAVRSGESSSGRLVYIDNVYYDRLNNSIYDLPPGSYRVQCKLVQKEENETSPDYFITTTIQLPLVGDKIVKIEF